MNHHQPERFVSCRRRNSSANPGTRMASDQIDWMTVTTGLPKLSAENPPEVVSTELVPVSEPMRKKTALTRTPKSHHHQYSLRLDE